MVRPAVSKLSLPSAGQLSKLANFVHLRLKQKPLVRSLPNSMRKTNSHDEEKGIEAKKKRLPDQILFISRNIKGKVNSTHL